MAAAPFACTLRGMFFSRSEPPAPVSAGDTLEQLIRSQLPTADDETLRLVLAVTGLLACVAYADRHYSQPEQQRIRSALLEIEGLRPEGVDAICRVLHDDIARFATGNMQLYTRSLRDHAELSLRREILDLLVDLAAADGELSLSETDLLRRTAAAMALTQDDYVASQARHLDKLKTLK